LAKMLDRPSVASAFDSAVKGLCDATSKCISTLAWQAITERDNEICELRKRLHIYEFPDDKETCGGESIDKLLAKLGGFDISGK
jgi:hypothetical protein